MHKPHPFSKVVPAMPEVERCVPVRNSKDPTPKTRVVEGYAWAPGIDQDELGAAQRAAIKVGKEEEELSFGEDRQGGLAMSGMPHGSSRSTVGVRARPELTALFDVPLDAFGTASP